MPKGLRPERANYYYHYYYLLGYGSSSQEAEAGSLP